MFRLRYTLLFLFSGYLTCLCASGEDTQTIRVFVALCDNKTQGIMRVGEKIGDGDKPEANLYWGCSDGLGLYFKKSRHWTVVESEKDISAQILRRMTLSHKTSPLTLIADAYRGSEMRQCYLDFESAASSGDYALVAYIGHNALMDSAFAQPESAPAHATDAIVLACVSDSHCSSRLRTLGCRPVLMTRQLMYPGAFILHDAIEAWRKKGTPADIRLAAGKAYAGNQGISVKAATGIFADLAEDSE